MLENLVYQGLMGISMAAYLWMAAAGLTLIFGVLGIVNFAHGSFYMLGAYVTLALLSFFGGNYWPALIIAPTIVSAIGGFVERFLIKPLYRVPMEFQILLTYGLILFFDDLVKIIWGPQYIIPKVPKGLDWSFPVIGGELPFYYLFVVIVACSVALALYWIIFKTRWGMKIRAASTEKEMAGAVGINVRNLYTQTFILGIWITAFGGSLSIPVRPVSPGLGEFIIVECFVITVIGGLGSLKGAFVGSFLVGLLHAYGLAFAPLFEMAFTFILMAAVLIVKPEGLFGKR